MTIQDELRKLTTGGPGVTHIASETLFNDAADEIDKLEFAITRWKKYETDMERDYDAKCAEVERLREALRKIQGWDCLNPPRPDLLGDLPWLRTVVDDALRAVDQPNPAQST